MYLLLTPIHLLFLASLPACPSGRVLVQGSSIYQPWDSILAPQPTWMALREWHARVTVSVPRLCLFPIWPRKARDNAEQQCIVAG